MRNETPILFRVPAKMKDIIERNAEKRGYKTVSEYLRALIIADADAEELKEMLME